MILLNAKNITDYIDYLISECSLTLSVHFSKDAFATLPTALCDSLLPYNSHNNPYCMAIKRNFHKQCICSQRELYKTCKPYHPICRTCFAGVSEYIYPVSRSGSVIGFIAVSGYRSEDSDSSLSEFLKASDLPENLCNSVIPPLAIMLEKLFSESFSPHDEYNLILQYINEYYSILSLPELAEYFHRSKSHISHMFKSRTGKSLSAYCNDLKLRDAAKLLETTDLSVTEIALDTGFGDSSYFISVFKKSFGKTPLQYRMSYRKT